MRAPRASGSPSGARRPLVRRADRRQHPGIRFHPLPVVALSPGDGRGSRRPGRSSTKRRAPFSTATSDGGLNIYVQGISDVNASVKAYVALKLAGVPVDDPRMARLRQRILELGGIQAANSYVKVNLSLFDSTRAVLPQHSPEVCCCRSIFYTRCPPDPRHRGLAGYRPRRQSAPPVPPGFNLDEIWLPGVSPGSTKTPLAHLAQRLPDSGPAAEVWERSGSKSVRRKAIEKAKAWMIERMHGSEGWAPSIRP